LCDFAANTGNDKEETGVAVCEIERQWVVVDRAEQEFSKKFQQRRSI
jgi:hypothetical protein